VTAAGVSCIGKRSESARSHRQRRLGNLVDIVGREMEGERDGEREMYSSVCMA
jgi:hypothetical protein